MRDTSTGAAADTEKRRRVSLSPGSGRHAVAALGLGTIEREIGASKQGVDVVHSRVELCRPDAQGHMRGDLGIGMRDGGLVKKRLQPPTGRDRRGEVGFGQENGELLAEAQGVIQRRRG